MSTVAFQVDIEAPIEHVWACLDDETKLPLWIPEIVETEFIAGRPLNDLSGARFRQTIRIGRRVRQCEGEVTLYHPPWLLGLRVGDANVRVMLTFDIYPIGTGTRIDYCIDIIAVTWTAMLVDAVVRPFTARLMARHLANLKRLAEDTYSEDALLPPSHVYFPGDGEFEPEPAGAHPDAPADGDPETSDQPAPASVSTPVAIPVPPPIAAE